MFFISASPTPSNTGTLISFHRIAENKSPAVIRGTAARSILLATEAPRVKKNYSWLWCNPHYHKRQRQSKTLERTHY